MLFRSIHGFKTREAVLIRDQNGATARQGAIDIVFMRCEDQAFRRARIRRKHLKGFPIFCPETLYNLVRNQ